MKKTAILKIIGIILVCSISIIICFWSGVKYGIDIAYNLYQVPFETRLIAEAVTSQSILSRLDKNQIQEGHSYVLIGLNANIIALESFVEVSNDKTNNEKIIGFLKRVADHRKNYPAYYSSYDSNSSESMKIYSEVDRILSKYQNK